MDITSEYSASLLRVYYLLRKFEIVYKPKEAVLKVLLFGFYKYEYSQQHTTKTQIQLT